MGGHPGTQMIVLHCTAKGLSLIVPPSLFSTFFLVPQDFGYFLSRQGAGQAEEVHCFAGGDPVPGDTSARYSPASPSRHWLCHGHKGVQTPGVWERTGHVARSCTSALHRQKCKPAVPMVGSDVSGGCETSSAIA